MSYLSPIAAGLYHARHEPRLHMRLAFQVFGEGPMLEAIREFMGECSDRLIFDERYLTALQRLLVVYASPSAQLSRVLTSHQRATLLTCLLSMGDVLPEWSPPEPSASGDYDVSAWTNYAVQRGAYYNTPDMLEGIVRASTMLIDIANEPDLEKHPDYCPLETWAVEDFEGLTLPDQLAVGMALAVGTRALDPAATLHERLAYIERGFLQDVPYGDREEAIFDAISATHEDLRDRFQSAGTRPDDFVWDHTVFEQRPFLRRNDNTFILISPRALAAWMGRGLYFRALDSARSKPRPGHPGQTLAPRFLTFGGVLAERYVLRLVEASHQRAAAIPASSAVVRGEQSYSIGKRDLLSPDVSVAQPPDLVLMEVYSGRIPREARITSSKDLMEQALNKMISLKLSELQARIADVLDEHVKLPGASDTGSLRVWPMLVLASEGLLQIPPLWRWTFEQLPEGAFSDQRVRPITICNLDDLEPLLALVERGETLPALLTAFHNSSYAQLPPRNWIAATQGLPASERPAYVDAQYKKAMDDVRRRLYPHSKSIVAVC